MSFHKYMCSLNHKKTDVIILSPNGKKCNIDSNEINAVDENKYNMSNSRYFLTINR